MSNCVTVNNRNHLKIIQIVTVYLWQFESNLGIISHWALHNICLSIPSVVVSQVSDIINKLAECQGKCWMFLYRETHKPRIEGPHNISCDNDRSKPPKQPSMDLTWSHLAGSVKLLLNFSFYYFAVRNTVQPRAAPAWVWSNVLYPDSEDKGPGLGVRKKKQQLWGLQRAYCEFEG